MTLAGTMFQITAAVAIAAGAAAVVGASAKAVFRRIDAGQAAEEAQERQEKQG